MKITLKFIIIFFFWGIFFLNGEKIPQCMLNYKIGTQHYVLIAEKSTNKLYIYSNYKSQPIKEFNITTGKKKGDKKKEGDLKTPQGIYFFIRELKGNQIPKTDDFGELAFTSNYPNPFDKLKKKTGSGIWLHGAFDSKKLDNPQNSKGCVVVLNKNIKAISAYITLLKTPFFIYDKIPYEEVSDVMKRRKDFLLTIKDWKIAWESQNIDDYISFYSKDFVYKKMDYHSFKKHKKKINSLYKFIRLFLSNIKLYRFHDNYVADFNQLYISDKNDFNIYKKQYWQYKDNSYFLIAESVRTLPKLENFQPFGNSVMSIKHFRSLALEGKDKIMANDSPKTILGKEKLSKDYNFFGIYLDSLNESKEKVVLNVQSYGKDKVRVIPVFIFKKDNSQFYKTIKGVNLRKGEPTSFSEAIIVKDKKIFLIPKVPGSRLIGLSVYVVDEKDRLRQILTDFLD